jgi:phytoene synthase
MTEKNYLALFAKSFNWAGFFLPKNTYHDCSKLYTFCRVLDDLVDEQTSLELRSEKFNKIKEVFEKGYKEANDREKLIGQNEYDLIVKNMIIIADKNNIKKIILDDLIEGVSSDLKSKVYLRSVKDLLVYSYRVAGSVGIMMAKILNVNDTRSLKGAIDLGIAMQLTNIARDVIEDKKMNRQYIKPDFENIEATLKLADMFYESSFTSIKNIPFKYKFAIIVARRVYRQIGRKILKKGNMNNYEKAGKIYINNFGKIFQTFLSLFDLMLLYLKNIEPHQRLREHEIIGEDINLDERI